MASWPVMHVMHIDFFDQAVTSTGPAVITQPYQDFLFVRHRKRQRNCCVSMATRRGFKNQEGICDVYDYWQVGARMELFPRHSSGIDRYSIDIVIRDARSLYQRSISTNDRAPDPCSHGRRDPK